MFLKQRFVNKLKQSNDKKKSKKQKRLFSQISQNSNSSTEKVIKSFQNTLQNNLSRKKKFDKVKQKESSYGLIYNKENQKKSKKTKKNLFTKKNSEVDTEYMIDHISVNKIHFKSFFNDTKIRDSVQNTKKTKESTAASLKKESDQIDKQILNLKKTLKSLNKKKQNNFYKEILKQNDLLKILKVLNVYFREKNQDLNYQFNYNINQKVLNYKKTLFSNDTNYNNMQLKLDQNLLNVQNILAQDSITLNSQHNSKQVISPLMNSAYNISNVEIQTLGHDNLLLNDSEMDLINDIKFNEDFANLKQSYRHTLNSTRKNRQSKNNNMLQQLLSEIREVKLLIEKKNSIDEKSNRNDKRIKPIQRPLIKVDFQKLDIFTKESQ